MQLTNNELEYVVSAESQPGAMLPLAQRQPIAHSIRCGSCRYRRPFVIDHAISKDYIATGGNDVILE